MSIGFDHSRVMALITLPGHFEWLVLLVVNPPLKLVHTSLAQEVKRRRLNFQTVMLVALQILFELKLVLIGLTSFLVSVSRKF